MVLHVLLLTKAPIAHLLKLAPFLLPLNLWLPLARNLTEVLAAVASTSSLLVLRLRLISAATHPHRWDRALRLFWRDLVPNQAMTDPNYLHHRRRRRRLLFSSLDASVDSIIEDLISFSI